MGYLLEHSANPFPSYFDKIIHKQEFTRYLAWLNCFSETALASSSQTEMPNILVLYQVAAGLIERPDSNKIAQWLNGILAEDGRHPLAGIIWEILTDANRPALLELAYTFDQDSTLSVNDFYQLYTNSWREHADNQQLTVYLKLLRDPAALEKFSAFLRMEDGLGELRREVLHCLDRLDWFSYLTQDECLEIVSALQTESIKKLTSMFEYLQHAPGYPEPDNKLSWLFLKDQPPKYNIAYYITLAVEDEDREQMLAFLKVLTPQQRQQASPDVLDHLFDPDQCKVALDYAELLRRHIPEAMRPYYQARIFNETVRAHMAEEAYRQRLIEFYKEVNSADDDDQALGLRRSFKGNQQNTLYQLAGMLNESDLLLFATARTCAHPPHQLEQLYQGIVFARKRGMLNPDIVDEPTRQQYFVDIASSAQPVLMAHQLYVLRKVSIQHRGPIQNSPKMIVNETFNLFRGIAGCLDERMIEKITYAASPYIFYSIVKRLVELNKALITKENLEKCLQKSAYHYLLYKVLRNHQGELTQAQFDEYVTNPSTVASCEAKAQQKAFVAAVEHAIHAPAKTQKKELRSDSIKEKPVAQCLEKCLKLKSSHAVFAINLLTNLEKSDPDLKIADETFSILSRHSEIVCLNEIVELCCKAGIRLSKQQFASLVSPEYKDLFHLRNLLYLLDSKNNLCQILSDDDCCDDMSEQPLTMQELIDLQNKVEFLNALLVIPSRVALTPIQIRKISAHPQPYQLFDCLRFFEGQLTLEDVEVLLRQNSLTPLLALVHEINNSQIEINDADSVASLILFLAKQPSVVWPLTIYANQADVKLNLDIIDKFLGEIYNRGGFAEIACYGWERVSALAGADQKCLSLALVSACERHKLNKSKYYPVLIKHKQVLQLVAILFLAPEDTNISCLALTILFHQEDVKPTLDFLLKLQRANKLDANTYQLVCQHRDTAMVSQVLLSEVFETKQSRAEFIAAAAAYPMLLGVIDVLRNSPMRYKTVESAFQALKTAPEKCFITLDQMMGAGVTRAYKKQYALTDPYVKSCRRLVFHIKAVIESIFFEAKSVNGSLTIRTVDLDCKRKMLSETAKQFPLLPEASLVAMIEYYSEKYEKLFTRIFQRRPQATKRSNSDIEAIAVEADEANAKRPKTYDKPELKPEERRAPLTPTRVNRVTPAALLQSQNSPVFGPRAGNPDEPENQPPRGAVLNPTRS